MSLSTMESRVERLEQRLGESDQAPFWLLVLVPMVAREGERHPSRSGRFLAFEEAATGRLWELQDGETREQLETRIEAEAKAEGRTSLMVTERYQEERSLA